MNRCGVCGTLGIFTILLTCNEKMGYYTNVWGYPYE